MAVPLLIIAASGMNLFVTIERVSDDKVWNSNSDTFTNPGVDVPNERINLVEGTGNRAGSYTAEMNSSGTSADTTAGGAYRLRVHDDDDAADKVVAGDIKYEVNGVECTAADVVKWRGSTPDGLQNGLVPVEVQSAAEDVLDDIAVAVWEWQTSSPASGSYGEFVQNYLIGIESNTDTIITNVGTVNDTVNGTAGTVSTNLDAQVSSRATPSDVFTNVWGASVGAYSSGTYGEFVQFLLPIKVMNTSVAAVAAAETIVQGGLAEMSLRTMSSEIDGDDFIVYALDGTTVLFTYTITRTPGALPVTKILV